MVAPLFARSRLTGRAPEILYNGITLGTPWPPRLRYPDEHPVTPPYLLNPPAVIPDRCRPPVVRRRLPDRRDVAAADLASCRILRRQPGAAPGDRVGADATPSAERNNRKINPAAMLFSDGVFFDPRDRAVQDVVHGRLRHPHLPGDLDRRHRLDAAVVRCGEGHEHHIVAHRPSDRAIRARCGSI